MDAHKIEVMKTLFTQYEGAAGAHVNCGNWRKKPNSNTVATVSQHGKNYRNNLHQFY